MTWGPLSSGQAAVADAIGTHGGAADHGDISRHGRRKRLASRKGADSRDLPPTNQASQNARGIAQKMLSRTDRQLVGIAVRQSVPNIPGRVAAFGVKVVV